MRRLAALLVTLLFCAGTAAATIETDPATLYKTMKDAYEKGSTQGWSYQTYEYYLSTIFDAGRAYSLQGPDDPNYGEVAFTAVTVASQLHYNPLNSRDAAPWYVREVANYVLAHSPSPEQSAQARALIERIDAMEDPATEATFADRDATANLRNFAGDKEARIAQVVADWRAFVITKNPMFRALAFSHAARPGFPILQITEPVDPEIFNAAHAAAAGVAGYSAQEMHDAAVIIKRLASITGLRVIGRTKVLPFDEYLTQLAPADEYFGRTGMSILGMRNEIKRIDSYLRAGWGARESNAAVELADSIDHLHRIYPKDRDLPQLLYQAYMLLGRIDTGEARASAAAMRTILTIEYNDTSQARQLLGS